MPQIPRTILVVDDSPEDRELYRRYLRRDLEYAYTILEASLGQQGLDLWQQHPPDAIVLDYCLPDLDGLEFLARLQPLAQQSCLPVVVVTGQGNEAIAVQAMKAGAQDYLVKEQITPEGLRLAIGGAIETVQLRTQLQQRIKREHLVAQITQKIYQTLDLDEILQTTVTEVRQFLQTDRVLIFRLQPDGWGTVTTESVAEGWTSLISRSYQDPCFRENAVELFRQGLVTVKPDIYDGSLDPGYQDLLVRLQVRANLVVPILQHGQLWGMLIVHHCRAPRQWQSLEVTLLKELAAQVGIALQQAELYQQTQYELAERKRVEVELRASEERLNSALKATRTGLWNWDFQTGQIQWSESLEPLFGYEPGQFDGSFKMFIDRVHPDDREHVQAAVDQAIATGESYEIEFRVIYPNGRLRWALSQGKVFYDAVGQAVRMSGNDIDITERKQAEATLQESEQRFRQLAENINAVFWIREASENRVAYVSPAFERLWGLDPQELYDNCQAWINRIHPEDREATARAFGEKAAAGLFDQEYRIVLPDGPIRWVRDRCYPLYDNTGALYRFTGIAEDITERKQVEEALRKNEQLLRLALTGAQAGSWDWEIPTGKIVWSSENFALYGLSPTDTALTYEDWYQALHPEDRDWVNAEVGRVAEQHLPEFRAEFRIVHPQKGIRWLLGLGQLSLDSQGHPVRLSGINLDITARKQAEAALQKSEAQLKLANRATQLGLWDWDIQLNRAEVTEEYCTLFGIAPPQQTVSYEQWFSLIHPDDRAAINAVLGHTFPQQQKYYAVDYRILHPDGIRWIASRSQAFYDAKGHLVRMLGNVQDVTGRKQAEEALRQSEERYRTLFESMEDGFCVIEMLFDEQDRPIDYRFLEINPAFEEHTGLQKAEGKTVRQLVPNLESHWFKTYGNVALTGESVRFENHSEAMNRWFDVYAFRVGQPEARKVALLFKEISDRKQAEGALRERTEHNRLLYETTRDLLSTDQPLQLVETVVEALKTLTGVEVYFNYVLDESQKKLRLAFYSGISDAVARDIEWLDLGQAICGIVAQTQCQVVQSDVQHATDPKTELVRSLGLTAYACQPLVAQGKLFGTLGFGSRHRPEFTTSERNLFQAICDQIAIALDRAELVSSLQQQTEELIRANRIKDEFLTILSHELRSPLNPILGWAKLLQTGKFNPARTAEALAAIERNAKLQTQLIDDLLDVAKILRGKLNMEVAPVDLVFVVEAALDTVKAAAAAKNIHLHPVLPAIGQIAGDATRLQQIVWNLLSNAIKFTPSGGRVEVQLSVVRGEPAWPEDSSQSPLAPGSLARSAQITVSDTGKGINPAFLPHIFESFRQEDASTTRKYGGLGLGLAIVRHLVEAHDGTIKAESRGEDQGSTFTVRFPLLDPIPELNPSEYPPWQEPDLTGIRVLTVDDEPDTRELFTAVLTHYGADVLAVASVAEALATLKSFQPDVLVSDIGMPGMDGYSLIQKIRTLPADQGGHVPAIALTAYAREEDHQQALSSGYQGHITKPLEPERLVRAVMALAHPRQSLYQAF